MGYEIEREYRLNINNLYLKASKLKSLEGSFAVVVLSKFVALCC